MENVRKRSLSGRTKKSGSKILGSIFHIGSIDVIFTCYLLIIFGIGVIMLYSASYDYAQAYASSPSYYFKRQLFFGLVGIAAMFLISKIDYRILNSFLVPVYMIAVSALLVYAVVAGGGEGINRWISIGPIRFQPSEFMKFGMILSLSYMLCILYEPLRAGKGKKVIPQRKKLTKPERFIYYFLNTPLKASSFLICVVGIVTLLVLAGKHLSGAIIICLVGMSMLWVGGADRRLLVALTAAAIVVVALVIYKPELLKLFSDYASERVMVWKAKQTIGETTYYQTKQGLYAIGSGGLFGVGLGNSKQKLLYVPEPQNDFIYPIACEELGFVGAVFILILFALLIYRGFKIASKTTDYFGALLTVGIMMQIGIQVILNVAVVTDTIPNTGVPLPFFSYGGTALLVLFCEMGVVLSVSRRSYLDKQ